MPQLNADVPRGTILKQIGQAFLLRRTELGLQYKELEEMSGVSSITISDLEKGNKKNTSIETLAKIAEALGLELEITATLNSK